MGHLINLTQAEFFKRPVCHWFWVQYNIFHHKGFVSVRWTSWNSNLNNGDPLWLLSPPQVETSAFDATFEQWWPVVVVLTTPAHQEHILVTFASDATQEQSESPHTQYSTTPQSTNYSNPQWILSSTHKLHPNGIIHIPTHHLQIIPHQEDPNI